MQKSVYGNAIPIDLSTVPTTLQDLSDIEIVAPSNNQVLTYDNGVWKNETPALNGVNSFNSRSGNVLPLSGDYNISQITNSSVLSSTGNVNISSPTNKQAITYNAPYFVNSNLNLSYLSDVTVGAPVNGQALIYNGVTYTPTNIPKYMNYLNVGTSWTALANYMIYTGSLCTVSLDVNNFNTGDKVQMTVNSNTLTIVSSGNPIFLNTPANGDINPTITLTTGTIELLCISPHYFVITKLTLGNMGSTGYCYINSYKLSSLATINNIQDVNISSPASGEILSYNGSQWVNTQDHAYYTFVRTSSTSVTASPNSAYLLTAGGLITINPFNVGDHILIIAETNSTSVTFGGVSFVTNSFLGGGTSNPTFVLKSAYVELMCVFNTGQTYYDICRMGTTRSPAILTLNGTKMSSVNAFTDIPDVVLTSPSSGEALTFNGSSWVNTSLVTGVSSFNSRTGAILPASGDYSITQLSGVSISSPLNRQLLMYNGSNWINDFSYGLNEAIYVSSGTTVASLNKIYIAVSATIQLPGCSASDRGKRILISTDGVSSFTLNVPNGITLRGYTNFTTSSFWGGVGLVVGGANSYSIYANTSTFLNPSTGKPFLNDNIGIFNLSDTTITSPQSTQYLQYNGSAWVNAYQYTQYFYNSTNNLIANQFLLADGMTGNVTKARKVSAGNFYIESIICKLVTAPGVGASRSFTIYLNGVATSMVLTISGTNLTASTNSNNVSGVAFDDVEVFHTVTGTPSASQVALTVTFR